MKEPHNEKKNSPPTLALVPFYVSGTRNPFFMWNEEEKEKFLEFTFRMCLGKFLLFALLCSRPRTHKHTDNDASLCERNRYNAGWAFLEKQWRRASAQGPFSPIIMNVKRQPLGKFKEEYREVSEWIQGLKHRTGEKGELFVGSHILELKRTLLCALDVSRSLSFSPQTMFWFRRTIYERFLEPFAK